MINKFLQKSILFVFLFLGGSNSYAYETYFIDGIYYILNDDEAIVTYNSIFPNKSRNAYSGDVVIPQEISYNGKTYRVTRIGGGSFADCTDLISVSLPNSINSILVEAFKNCTSLKNIDIPNGVSFLGNKTFFDCNNLKSINIPKSLTEIGEDAFTGCI